MSKFTFREWKAEYESIMAYGRQMGWVRTRDPLKQPIPREDHNTNVSLMEHRMREKKSKEDDNIRTFMGH